MRFFSAVLAITAAILVLLGLFLPLPAVQLFRQMLLQWGLILGGTATLVGLYNLLAVHTQQLRRGGLKTIYSLVLLLAALFTFIFVLLLGPDSPTVRLWIVMGILRPVEASLLGILAVTLIYALMRLVRRRLDFISVLFLLSAFFFLLAAAPMPWGGLPLLADFLAPWAQDVLVTAGTRGLLLGMALGALTAGLRLLLAADRPYGGN